MQTDKRSTPKHEQNHATRIWAELAIIEQGSLGIVRHLKMLLDQRSVAELFDQTVTTSRVRAKNRAAHFDDHAQ